MTLTTKKILATAMVIVTLSIMALPVIVSAQGQANFDLGTPANWGLGNTDLKVTITRVLGVLLGFLGTLAVLIILYGGFIWMTAMGDESKVEKAKKLIIAGIIGIVVILSAYAIASFVLTNIQNATTGS